MPFVRLFVEIALWAVGYRYSPLLTGEHEKRGVRMQQFGAAFAAVKKRRYRRQSVEQLIYQLG